MDWAFLFLYCVLLCLAGWVLGFLVPWWVAVPLGGVTGFFSSLSGVFDAEE